MFNDKGSKHIDTELVTKITFKLENDNRTFLLEGGELIEKGDELGFYANANKDGFYKVLLCKNFTRTWFKDYAKMGLWSLIKSLLRMAFLSYIIYLILIYFVFDNKILGNIICAIIFIFLGAMVVLGGLSDLKLRNKKIWHKLKAIKVFNFKQFTFLKASYKHFA